MKEIMATYRVNLLPQSEEDAEILANEFKLNQPVRVKVYSIGAQKQRSNAQLNTLMACCQLVADNARQPQFNSKAKVKFAIKVHTDFRDPNITFVRPDGTVQFHYRSFGFDTLSHMESCNIFERGFDFLASILGISKDELIKEAQSKMLRR